MRGLQVMRSLLLFSAAFGLYHGFLNPEVMNRIIAVEPTTDSPAETTEEIQLLVKLSTKLLVQKQPGAKVYITTIDESTGNSIAQHQRIVPKVRKILEDSKLTVTDELSANCTVVITLRKENSNGNSGQKYTVDVFTIEKGKTTKTVFVEGSVSERSVVPSEGVIVPGVGPKGEKGAVIITHPLPALTKNGTLDKKIDMENILKAYSARQYVVPASGNNCKFGPNMCLEAWVAVAQLSEIKSKKQLTIEDYKKEFKKIELERTGPKNGNLILNPKDRYIVVVKNNGKEPVGVYLDIDGIPFDEFKKGDLKSGISLAYLIEPNDTQYFIGWLIDSKNVSAFDVQEYPPDCKEQNQKNGSIQLTSAVAKKEGPEADKYQKEHNYPNGTKSVTTKKPDPKAFQPQDTVISNYVLFGKTSTLTIGYQEK